MLDLTALVVIARAGVVAPALLRAKFGAGGEGVAEAKLKPKPLLSANAMEFHRHLEDVVEERLVQ